MMTYEYRMVPAPEHAGGKGRSEDAEEAIRAKTKLVNLRAQAGWEYVATETVRVRRRGWLPGRRTEARDYLVFRRSLGWPLGTSAQPGQAAQPAPSDQRPRADETVEGTARRAARPDLVEAVRAGRRRVVVTPPGPLLLAGPLHPGAASLAAE